MLGTLVAESDVPFPAICCVVLFTTCAWVLARPCGSIKGYARQARPLPVP